jgi:predicted AAA+ superfamily ATPase
MSGFLRYPRFAEARLRVALTDTPVVLIHGPRQSGKTTLARAVGDPLGYAYVTFDDDEVLAAAETDPIGFIMNLPPRTILDEVQKVPWLFTTIKLVIDRDRVPGRFILTGSANVLLLPKLGDSLAGRMEILRLHPLAQCELAGRPPAFLDALLAGKFRSGSFERLGRELADRVVAGGYPAAIARSTSGRRAAWYRDHLEAQIQRDVRSLARISDVDAISRLLQVAAGRTGRLLNASDLAAPFELSRPTIRQYLSLLERVFLVDLLPPWHTNRLSRLIKAPKLHVGDTGLVSALLGISSSALFKDRELFGQLLETFVFQELRRQASWDESFLSFYHFRDKDDAEVDVVLERGATDVAGVEVKAGATLRSKDFRGLRKLKEAAGKRFAAGVVLYDGEHILPFGEQLYAVPIRALWETT